MSYLRQVGILRTFLQPTSRASKPLEMKMSMNTSLCLVAEPTRSIAWRGFSTNSLLLVPQATFSTAGEKTIHDILRDKFPLATEVEVKDISGGCGSMYEIYITSSEVSCEVMIDVFRSFKVYKKPQLACLIDRHI